LPFEFRGDRVGAAIGLTRTSRGRDDEYRIKDCSSVRISRSFRIWHQVTIRAGATALVGGPWLSVFLVVVSVLLWLAAYGNLLVWSGPFTLIVTLGAVPLAAATTVDHHVEPASGWVTLVARS
jgi:hypothetical protein